MRFLYRLLIKPFFFLALEVLSVERVGQVSGAKLNEGLYNAFFTGSSLAYSACEEELLFCSVPVDS